MGCRHRHRRCCGFDGCDGFGGSNIIFIIILLCFCGGGRGRRC